MTLLGSSCSLSNLQFPSHCTARLHPDFDADVTKYSSKFSLGDAFVAVTPRLPKNAHSSMNISYNGVLNETMHQDGQPTLAYAVKRGATIGVQVLAEDRTCTAAYVLTFGGTYCIAWQCTSTPLHRHIHIHG